MTRHSVSTLLLGALFVSLLSGCAALTRNQCEKVNWFERGEVLALDGKYPSSDSQLKECRKVEAKIEEGDLDSGWKRGRELYCQPERAFSTGKNGKLFAPDICEQGIVKTLLKKHAEGVRAYCVPDTGRQLGAAGSAYNSICPGDLETPFKAAYQKARRGYLEGLVPGLQNEIQQKQMQISQKRTELSYLEGQRSALNNQLAYSRGANAASAQTMQLGSQVDDLDQKIRVKQNEVYRIEKQIRDITTRIANIQAEASGLREGT